MADKLLWAPWRAGFILSEKEKGCIFCTRLKRRDSLKNLILYRGRKVFVIMNKFPYNTGHVMVVPMRHVGQLERLTAEEASEFMALIQRTTAVVKKVLRPDAMNLGMNLGRSSGAGIPGHLHMHIVPRWNGDTNFMPIIGKTRVISVPLGPVYKQLRAEFRNG